MIPEPTTDLDDDQAEAPADEADPKQPVAADPLALAGNLLVEALTDLRSKPASGQRLEHKVEIARGLVEFANAQGARAQINLMQQAAAAQQQAIHDAQERAKGPAGIVVPTIMPNGRG